MGRNYLLKCGFFDRDTHDLVLPNRAFPERAPQVGDRLFIWVNALGLVAEARVFSLGSDGFKVGDWTIYGDGIGASWLERADRKKTSIRSKLHCDRHDRLWCLTEAEVLELDNARRFGGQ